MGKIFNNKVFDGLSKMADVMIVSVYFWVCSLPIFTMGASATGLYYATHKCIFKGRGYNREFFSSFKENFKQATLSWLIFLAVFLILACDIFITKNVVDPSSIIAAAPIFFMVIFAFVIVWAIYHFAYIARFENNFKDSFKVSAIFMFANLGWTFVIFGIIILALIIVERIPILLLFAPAIIAASVHPILEKIFRKYMSPEDLAKEDEF